jgi:hypothetical protein
MICLLRFLPSERMYDLKNSLFLVLLIIVILSLSACVWNTDQSDKNDGKTTIQTTSDASLTSESNTNKERTAVENSSDSSEVVTSLPTISIQVGDQTFHATMTNDPSSIALIKRLPLTLDMRELNGNEKFYYFSEKMPSDSAYVGDIQAGDLMLYGSDCLVLFYKGFSTSYSYTRLGSIEEAAGLAKALGSESVTLTFEINK